ncbi:unnamed protein product [Cylindrotheca closterium]|uniref:Uncharacterized protein n=1 Tax=Cylindrotheca closterium TaxID=2856 RepID=A0AAD2FTC8_9STRA|nr:unnamed protein product [Cylindrotheca closterium]
MRQTNPLDFHSSSQQRQTNGTGSDCQSICPLIFSSVGGLCCLCVLIGGIAGLVYSSSYFEAFVETQATIIGTTEMDEFQHSNEKLDPFNNDFDAKYCPTIQFFTVGGANPRNITTVLEFDCKENKGEIELGETVGIRYDPSDPTDVLDESVPSIVEVAMICVISISALCSSCCVVIGIILYKLLKARNKAQYDTTDSDANNFSNPSSVQMANLNVNHTRHMPPNGYNDRNEYNSATDPFERGPIETTLSAAFPEPAVPMHSSPEVHPEAISIPVYPEGTYTSTAIAAGDEVPPIVGCTLIPSDTTTAPPRTQTYVSPSSLPMDPPESSFVSHPSEIHEA